MYMFMKVRVALKSSDFSQKKKTHNAKRLIKKIERYFTDAEEDIKVIWDEELLILIKLKACKETAAYERLKEAVVTDKLVISASSHWFESFADENEELSKVLDQTAHEGNESAWEPEDGESASIHKRPSAEELIQRAKELDWVPEFQRESLKIIGMASGVIENKCEPSYFSEKYLFVIDDDNQAQQYGSYFADLHYDTSLFKNKTEKRVVYYAFKPASPMQLTQNDADRFPDLDSDWVCNRVFHIDLSGYLDCLMEAGFRQFLIRLNENRRSFVTIFRIPSVSKRKLEQVQTVLGKVVNLRTVCFPPLADEQIQLFARKKLQNHGFVVSEMFERRLVEFVHSQRGLHGGFSTANISLLLDRTMMESFRNGLSMNLDEHSVIPGEEKAGYVSQTAQATLDRLVGMSGIKKSINEIVATIELHKKLGANEEHGDLPSMHMQFRGQPGTGKTEVARIVGKILREKGILRIGNFYETSRKDLVAKYVGQTSLRTSEVCREALGSVLLVDEAYSLYASQDSQDYGPEAISTMISFMENNRDDIVIIFAGYADKMDELMTTNSGLSSRIPYSIDFPDYTGEELFRIFMTFINPGLDIDNDFELAVRNYFQDMEPRAKKVNGFGNARFARNLYERTFAKAAVRMMAGFAPMNRITVDDFFKASSDKEFQLDELSARQGRQIGFQQSR